jgi:alkylation response protein AidB-like acyl-CoA dehydrogenase
MNRHPDDLQDFRTRVREWAEANVPTGWAETHRASDEQELLQFQRQWLKTLRAGGYAVPHWSREHGGAGFSLAEQVVVFEEFARAGAPNMRAFFVAFNHAYATLREGGTPEQRARFLPAILDGQTWCQGFSEPGAGSDLASLRTRAVRDGDHYVVNGQKIWSSGATRADYCLLLTRTDPDVPKRKGITFLLMDMRSPGVDIRPIKQATGQSEFCELFLTDVHIPVINRVGDENDGWRIAQATLSAERGPTILELGERLAHAIDMLVELATNARVSGGPALADPLVRETLAEFDTRVHILRLLCRKVVSDLIRKGGTGPEASIIKVYYSETLQSLMRFGVDLAGPGTQRRASKPITAGWESGLWMLDYLDSWGWTIGGGTNEIQRTVVGERVLGLPREPSAH